MKKILIRILVLTAVFVAAVLGFSFYLNRGTSETKEAMAGATFPLVYMTNEGSRLNRLHGYTTEMDVTAMRDTLTPLEADRSLTIQIEPYKNKISEVSYEILSSDGTKSMERTKINKLTEEDSLLKATLNLQNDILINTEYVLKLEVTAGNRTIYYYTRLIYEDDLHTRNYLDFATGFYERCLNKNDLDTISAYIEPSEEGDNTTLDFVDIHCSMDQISWGNLSPTAYYKPTPSLKEINQSTATIVMDYMISAKNSQEETELYAVSEYYRMLYTEERIRLLDFERTTNQIFNPENSSTILSSGINLGIASRDTEYLSNRENTCVAFVQQGALWMYQTGANKMVQVFSFPQEKNSDARDTYSQNDIQIINLDEAGNMFFLVCGYMNRGEHEGESGVDVFYFNAQDSSITECLFVETKQNYELLKRDVESLRYISADRAHFYLCVDGTVYGVDLTDMQAETIVSGMKEDCFASSRSGQYFAWMTGDDAFHSQSVEMLNLDTREKRSVSCAEGERIRILGFLKEDLVCGIADTADVNTDHEGLEFFPMKKIQIINGKGELVKEYSQDGYYVTEAVIESRMMTMQRVQKKDGAFVEASEEHIVNSQATESGQSDLTSRTIERKQTERILTVGTTLNPEKVPQIIRSRETVQEGDRTITLTQSGKPQEVYYVYAKGRLLDVYPSISQAVKKADEELGVVVDENLQNIWERGNRVTKLTLDVSTFPEAFHQGNLSVEEIERTSGRKALDLSGCTMDSVLYYISEGTPILAKTPVTEKTPQGVVMIAGYDEYNTLLVNPGETETFYYGLNDSKDLFEQAGNIFMTYWDPISD